LDDEEQPGAEVFTETANLEQLSQMLQTQGFAVVESEWRWIPGNTVEITDLEQSKQLLKLLETLESLDDIQNVTANFEMSVDLMALSMN
jgi:transcriptional/translational regulatory protein YebC/TACO1